MIFKTHHGDLVQISRMLKLKFSGMLKSQKVILMESFVVNISKCQF